MRKPREGRRTVFMDQMRLSIPVERSLIRRTPRPGLLGPQSSSTKVGSPGVRKALERLLPAPVGLDASEAPASSERQHRQEEEERTCIRSQSLVVCLEWGGCEDGWVVGDGAQ